jgi:hypothetical protein
MLPEALDRIFPFLLTGYGVVMTFILHSRFFMELAETRMPEAITQQIKAHRLLGLFCLVGGSFWSLQNLWL